MYGNSLQLRPSQILYSQDSISNTFDVKSRHSDTRIGETLDQLCNGRCSINEIPRIRVCRSLTNADVYISADNRRLWVFRQLERLGGCVKIPVTLINRINAAKLTTENDGREIRVRGPPGGVWYRKSSRGTPRVVSRESSMYESGDMFFGSNSDTRPRVSSTARSHDGWAYESTGNRSVYDSRRTYPSTSNAPLVSPYRSFTHNYRSAVDDDSWCPCTIL